MRRLLDAIDLHVVWFMVLLVPSMLLNRIASAQLEWSWFATVYWFGVGFMVVAPQGFMRIRAEGCREVVVNEAFILLVAGSTVALGELARS
jgi:hypothetical protein